MQERTINPLVAVVGMTAAALAVVGVLGVLAARSQPAPGQAASAGAPRPLPAPAPVVQRKPATSAALPSGTGTGRRIVYALGIRRIWMVGRDGQPARTYQVPRGQPQLSAGTYRVYARRLSQPVPQTKDRIRYVLRMEQGKGGGSRVGFCSVPLSRSGKPARPIPQGGIEAAGSSCIQQRLADARYLWRATPVGTTVVVVP